MSGQHNALKQYKSVDVRATIETASPHKLIAMMIEGLLKELAQAKGFCEREDIQGRTDALNKASRIVISLKGYLDQEKGGEVAANLERLYDYMINRIYQANRNNDASIVQEVIELTLEVNAGWNAMPIEYKVGDNPLG